MSSTRLRSCAFYLIAAFFLVSPIVATLPAHAAKKVEQFYGVFPYPRSRGLSSQDAMVEMVQLLKQARANAHSPKQSWTVLEPARGVYNLSEFSQDYYRLTLGFNELWNIQVINTNVKTLPPDLAGQQFDAPVVKQRFHKLINALKPHVDARVKFISVGNEVDAYLESHPDEWDNYRNFYQDAVTYIHKTLPGVKVGVTCTYLGLFGKSQQQLLALNQASDVLVTNYYPVVGPNSLLFAPPTAPATDLPKMVSLARGKPVLLQECGYSASPLLNGSETNQSAFVFNVFATLKKLQNKIVFVEFFAAHDFPPELVDSFLQYYSLGDDKYSREFLSTLGFRKIDGTPRQAWSTLLITAPRK